MLINIKIASDAKKWLEEWLEPSYCGCEFGSGFSTIWLAQRVKQLVSVDHDKAWYGIVNDAMEQFDIKNVDLICEPSLILYHKAVDKYNKTFDFVFIDGYKSKRVECVNETYKKVRPNGILILDDSHKPYHSSIFKLLNDWERMDFKSPCKTGGYRYTSIWIKKDNTENGNT